MSAKQTTGDTRLFRVNWHGQSTFAVRMRDDMVIAVASENEQWLLGATETQMTIECLRRGWKVEKVT